MYLKDSDTGDLVEVLDISALIDPFREQVAGRFHSGEELQDPAYFEKKKLLFPSGEQLPRAWLDASYRG